jgi:hypothetical protein
MEKITAHRPTMWPKESKWFELHYLLHHMGYGNSSDAIRVRESDVGGRFSYSMKNNLREWVHNQNLACARYHAQYRIGAQWEHDRGFLPKERRRVCGPEHDLLPAEEEMAVVVWKYDMDEWFETPNT